MRILNKVTLKNLKKNKVRTLVTIIGIILSVSMFTAVTTTVSSFQQYMIDLEKEKSGSYECQVFNVSSEKLENIKKDSEFNKISAMKNFGYAKADRKTSEYTIFYVGGIDDNFKKLSSLKITEGRMPKNSAEIIIPDSFKNSNEYGNYKIGDIINLNIEKRMLDKKVLGAIDAYDENESINDTSPKTYTIVGSYETSVFSDFQDQSTVILTLDDKNIDADYNVLYNVNNTKNIYDITKKYFKGYKYSYNSSLLAYSGYSSNNNFQNIIYGFEGIMIAIIMLASISLIYNAFSISVSERTKQFGLLKSIGATKRQILKSVFAEAKFLCIIGIPLGLIAGIGGMALTLNIIGGIFKDAFTADSAVNLSLHISLISIVAAIIISIVTVLISSYIPAKRASRKTAISSIRQADEIKISAKKIKTSKLAQKIFGFESTIASKNFKRYRKKYRATVISLTLSIIIFLATASFNAYLSVGADSYDKYDYDIEASLDVESNNYSEKEITKSREVLSKCKGVKKSTRILYSNIASSLFNKEAVNEGLYNNSEFKETKNKNKVQLLSTCIAFVSDDIYKEYLNKNGYNIDEFTDFRAPKGFVKKSHMTYSDNKYKQKNVFKKNTVNADLYFGKYIKGYQYIDYDYSENELTYFKNGFGEEKRIKANESNKFSLELTCAEDVPFGLKANAYWSTIIVMPEMFYKEIINKYDLSQFNDKIVFSAKNHKTSYDEMIETAKNNDLKVDIYDQTASAESTKALMLIINIFTYGFIILMSLISVANIFNTISTNIALRRREFATLKSVGMTSKAFNKMMNYECLLYGTKSLLYGLPIGILISYLIWQVLKQGMETEYIFPIKPILIITIVIFAVVFITMLYSMRKIKKDNPIEALKDENI